MQQQIKTKKQKLVSKAWTESFGVKFRELNKFRADGTYCDVTLETIDDKKVKAHRNILHTGSGFFRNLFTSGMRDSSAGSIELKHMKGDHLDKVITFLYCGEVEVNQTEDIEEITQYANYFQMNELVEECTKLLSNLIDNNNCLKYWRLAQECFDKKFEKLCISHVLTNLLYDKDEFFLKLWKEEIKVLYSDSRLKWSEEVKFEKILQWVKKEIKNQSEFEPTLSTFLEDIYFSIMSEKFLVTNVLGNSDLIGHEEIIKTIVKLATRKWNTGNVLPVGSNFKNLRNGLCAILPNKMMTVSSEGDMNLFQEKKHWHTRFGYTTFNNHIIICGGDDGPGKTNFCEFWVPTMKEWKDFPSLLTPRAGPGCIYFDDKIYVCGGLAESEIANTEYFDFGQEKWLAGSNMKSARATFGLCSVNRCLYALGGGWGPGNVEMFDPRTSSQWTEIHPKFQDKRFTQSFPIGSDIYCFRNEAKPCIFDIRTNEFRDWEAEFGYCKSKTNFQIYESNGYFNIVQKNENSNYIDFFKYDFKGDLVSSKVKTLKSPGWIGALAMLYYQN